MPEYPRHDAVNHAVQYASHIRDALTLFLKSLSQGCRRMLTVSYPGCADITADERQMIAILAAMQAEDDALLRSHLSWLVKKDYRSCVLDAAQILAELLKQQGLYLALPERQGYPAYRTLSIVREASHVA